MPPAADPTLDDGALVWNREVELVRRRRGGELRAISVVAPIKGHGLRVTRVDREREPALFQVAERLCSRAGAPGAEVDAALRARLVEVGLLVRAGEAPARVRFRCPAGEGAPPAPAPRERLRVDAGLRYHDELRPPAETRAPKQGLWLGAAAVARPEVSPFAEDCAWAFVEHAGAEAPGIVSVPDHDRPLFRALSPGARPPADLAPERIAALETAGVLVDPEAAERRRAARAEKRVEVAARLGRDHRAVLPGLIHSAQRAALRRYYRELVGEGHLRFGDHLVARRYSAHNEPLARWLQRRLAPLVSEVAGKPMQPAFSLVFSYRPGAALPPHLDRDPCELSVNVLLDHAPEPEGTSPWPLFLAGDEGGGGPAELALGDALFYRGKRLRHWREPLPEGHAATVVIFNYVDATFTGSLD